MLSGDQKIEIIVKYNGERLERELPSCSSRTGQGGSASSPVPERRSAERSRAYLAASRDCSSIIGRIALLLHFRNNLSKAFKDWSQATPLIRDPGPSCAASLIGGSAFAGRHFRCGGAW